MLLDAKALYPHRNIFGRIQFQWRILYSANIGPYRTQITKKAHSPEKNSIVSKVGLVPVPMPKHIWRNSALEKDSVGL